MPVTAGHGNPNWSREETILVLDLLHRRWPKIPDEQNDEVKELSALLRRLPIHPESVRTDRFRNPAGVYMKLQNLASLHPERAGMKGLSTSRNDRAVWADFGNDPTRTRQLAEQIRLGIEVLGDEDRDELADEDLVGREGALLERVHRIRERRRGYRGKVIRRVEGEHGQVCCEGCGVRPRVPDRAGLSMFEVHHLVPLALSASTITKLSDLALLCANCHRLIHAAMRRDDRHYGLAEFRAWLEHA